MKHQLSQLFVVFSTLMFCISCGEIEKNRQNTQIRQELKNIVYWLNHYKGDDYFESDKLIEAEAKLNQLTASYSLDSLMFAQVDSVRNYIKQRKEEIKKEKRQKEIAKELEIKKLKKKKRLFELLDNKINIRFVRFDKMPVWKVTNKSKHYVSLNFKFYHPEEYRCETSFSVNLKPYQSIEFQDKVFRDNPRIYWVHGPVKYVSNDGNLSKSYGINILTDEQINDTKFGVVSSSLKVFK